MADAYDPLPTVAAMTSAIRALVDARPADAEAVLAAPVEIAEARLARAAAGDESAGAISMIYEARRLASWRLEVFRSLEAGDDLRGPAMPPAGPAEKLDVWCARTGPPSLPRALARLEFSAAAAREAA